jgi:hypothetical protein
MPHKAKALVDRVARSKNQTLNWRIMKMNHMQSSSKLTATESLFRRAVKRFAYICAAGTLLLTATSVWAAGYHWTNLVSDIPGD